MAELKIKIKGRKDIYLTRNYNSFNPLPQNTDNVKFNDTVNDFSQWCLASSCDVPAKDKIKIVSLPDKGRLFYLLNPNQPSPTYADVTVGQEILISDLVYNKVLKFSAEGATNNQYTDNYTTIFQVERYCDTKVKNEQVFIHLNMIDEKIAPLEPTLEISNVIYSPDNSGYTTFTLTVKNGTYNGWLATQVGYFMNVDYVAINSEPYGVGLAQAGLGIEQEAPSSWEEVSIPAGVYQGKLYANITSKNGGFAELSGSIDFCKEQYIIENHRVEVTVSVGQEM